MTLAAWLHDINPWVVHITETLGVRWYGLAYIAGFIVAWLGLRTLARRGKILIRPEEAMDVVVTGAFGVLIGGRLGYVVFYEPSLLWTFTDSFPFWGVAMLNRGGMASHGGMIGVAVAAVLIARGRKNDTGERRRLPILHVVDLFALAAPPGLFFGRIANFVNGELLGRIVAAPGEPAPCWAVKFPQEIIERSGSELPQTHEQMTAIERLAFEHALPSQRETLDFQGAYAHLIEMIQSGNREIAGQLAPLISARHPSQLYQAAAEGLVVGAVLWFIWRRPRLPGVVGAWFLISYGVLRVATELVRLPDGHLTVQRIAGLSRGQWLSVLMVVAGVALLAVVTKRGGEKLGGWMRGTKPEHDPAS